MRSAFLRYDRTRPISWSRVLIRTVNVILLVAISFGLVRFIHALVLGYNALAIGYLLKSLTLFVALWVVTDLRASWRERRFL